MSNRKLESATHPKYDGPKYPEQLSIIQHDFETRRHKNQPVLEERFIEYFTQELALFFLSTHIKYYPEFTTADGTTWRAVRFIYIDNVRYIVALPYPNDAKHRDGSVSDQHVALYVHSDEEVSEKQLGSVAQVIVSIFEEARRHFDF